MPVAPTLQKYLDQTVTYEMISHDPTMSSTRTAEACHVPGDCVAKGVVLRRDEAVHYKPAVEIELMRTLKRALDPQNLMNPGKVIEI